MHKEYQISENTKVIADGGNKGVIISIMVDGKELSSTLLSGEEYEENETEQNLDYLFDGFIDYSLDVLDSDTEKSLRKMLRPFVQCVSAKE